DYITRVCLHAVFFFFFQAEDGIRDFHVTGVQTCALPILPPYITIMRSTFSAITPRSCEIRIIDMPRSATRPAIRSRIWPWMVTRSEERRVGKESRYRWSAYA